MKKQFEYRFDETLGYDSVRLSKVFTSRHDIIDYFNLLLNEYYNSLDVARYDKSDEKTERYHKALDHYNMLLTIGTNIFKIWLEDYKKC